MSADDVARYRYCNNFFSGTVSRIGILRDEQRLTVIIRSMEFPFASIFKLWMASQLVSGLQLIKPYTSISVACTLKCQELKGKTYAYSVHTALAKDCLSEQGSCGDWGSIEDVFFSMNSCWNTPNRWEHPSYRLPSPQIGSVSTYLTCWCLAHSSH